MSRADPTDGVRTLANRGFIGDVDLVGVCDDCLLDLALALAPLLLAMALVSRIASSPVSSGDCPVVAGAAFTVANDGVEDGAPDDESMEDCVAAKGLQITVFDTRLIRTPVQAYG